MAFKNSFTQKKVEFKEVVQYALLPEDVSRVVAYLAEPSDVLEAMEQLAMTGYEVAIQRNEKHENFSVCLKGVSPECVNAGKWLYGNGKTLSGAFCSAAFKHFEIFKQGEWKQREVKQDYDVS